MPIDLRALIQPGATALLTVEVQNTVVGRGGVLPELGEAVARTGMLTNIAALARSARAVGIPVVHCTAETRPDGFGGSRNARLFAATRKSRSGKPAPKGAFDVHPDVGAEPRDIVLPRLHGLSPMTGTAVDSVLRNEGITTIVATGVSMNIAVLALIIDAVNRSYQVVVPRDAVTGVNEEYVDAVFENTVSLIATVTTTAALIDIWGGAPS